MIVRLTGYNRNIVIDSSKIKTHELTIMNELGLKHSELMDNFVETMDESISNLIQEKMDLIERQILDILYKGKIK